MRRYFFDLKDGSSICDPEGKLFADDASALSYAVRAIREMIAEDLVFAGEIYFTDAVTIRDERGATVRVVTFNSVAGIEDDPSRMSSDFDIY